ncbi:MAG: class I SAM-dependent methyltransferase [Verrucomicrobiota bacterium]|jgi:2-polyprenyl-3-methyl-5-hydroxy-6-metoxy-1,4-benzoquinol methylase
MTRTLAGRLAQSLFLSRGKRLFEQNSRNWELPLSKFDKLFIGCYVILEDYSRGLFPPKFEDQAKAYAGEIAYRTGLPGLNLEAIRQTELRKPFWFGHAVVKYLGQFIQLMQLLDQLKLPPPARLLELGCGGGWMAEFLAIAGFDVTGTSIAPLDIEDARVRLQSILAKGIVPRLRFEIAPMESIADAPGPRNYYDAVFVFEALHHAFDWRRAIQSSFECIRPGGWLLICNEPNVLHTFISYRVAKLSNTHEIGFSRNELMRHLAKTGFVSTKYLGSPFHFWVKAHWIAAQKPK